MTPHWDSVIAYFGLGNEFTSCFKCEGTVNAQVNPIRIYSSGFLLLQEMGGAEGDGMVDKSAGQVWRWEQKL